jgi:tRNA(Ile)-lysidine synthase
MIIDQVHQFIQKYNLIPKGSTLVLGLSGGPDSLFLLHLLAPMHAQGKISLIAAHLDHQWREHSHKDVQFCLEVTQALGVPLVVGKKSELATGKKWNGSLEELGRTMRRQFLTNVAKEHNADLIALGHHAQDQQETFFIRLLRGASLSGLTAMRPKQGMYIRPLLQTNKSDIVAYLEQNHITYLTDPTNVSPEFLRNRIRNTVLPALQKCDTRFDQNFLQTLNRLQATEDYLHEHTQALFSHITRIENEKIWLNINQLLKLHQVMHYRIIMEWLVRNNVPFTPTEKFLQEIIRFCTQPGSKKHTVHHDWMLIKAKEWVTIDQHA